MTINAWKLPFFTDQRITEMLEQETRVLPLPDGTQRHVTGWWLMWQHFDYLVKEAGFEESFMLEVSLRSSAGTGLSFDAQLHEFVAYLAATERANPTAALLPFLLPLFKPSLKTCQDNETG